MFTFGPSSRGADADQFWGNVVLLMTGRGTNGSTVFTDKSSIARTLTTVGNAQVSTTNSKFGSGCALYDGTGDSVTAPDSNDFRFGTGDFTVEAWVRLASLGSFRNIVRFEASSPPYHLRINSANQVEWGTTGNIVNTVGTLLQDVWYHCAASRQGSTVRAFLDGVGNPATNSTDLSGTGGTMHIGGSSFVMNGRLEDVRITKGVARYTSNFTPPPGPFPLG
jgi:hypothetical protein